VSSSAQIGYKGFEALDIPLVFCENPRDSSLGLNRRELRHAVLDDSRERGTRTTQEMAMEDAVEQIQYSPGNYPDNQSLKEAIEEVLSDILVCQLITPNHLAYNAQQDLLLPNPHATPGLNTGSEGPSSEQEQTSLEGEEYSQDPDNPPVESESSEESDSGVIMMPRSRTAE
jgi:hypothetical protein